MKQEDIGAFIANLRKEQGWTQKEMASRLGYSFGLNTQPEDPLKGIVGRTPMNSVEKADMTDEEKALSNFANGTNIGKTYLSYRLDSDKKLTAIGLIFLMERNGLPAQS